MYKPTALLFLLAFLTATIILNTSCEEAESLDMSESDLIPIPSRINPSMGVFEMTSSTPINLIGDPEVLQPIADHFNAAIEASSGFTLKTYERSGASNGINIGIFEEGRKVEGAYYLDITSKNVVLSSRNAAGLFYGVQTLLQLLPPEIDSGEKQEISWKVGTGSINDSPTYEYRGAMLDVARHFFTVDQVKTFIDYIASYKMNRLHLHLTDDQGWRIEIKSWPKLTEVGGSTEVGGGEGGFYTQEEYKEIVQYAADRFITVIPEIDMPGHTNAALASYAELNCDNKARPLYTGIEVGMSTLCTSKEVVYKFVDDVIRELAAMTPGDYIHIGGDESHSTKKEDYITFMNRTQDIVKKHGKNVIAWDEIATATPVDSAVLVQFWASEENAKMGIVKGARIVLSPAKKAYLDMQYDSTSRLGLHWAAYIEADEAYNWKPNKYVKGIEDDDIYGIESPLWAETIENLDDIEYLMFPRVTAIGELAWSREQNLNLESYKKRLSKHGKRMKIKGINYYESPKIEWDAEGLKEDEIKG